MSHFHEIPDAFKVFSTEPEIRIRYSAKFWSKVYLLIFSLPLLVVFAGHCFILLAGFYEFSNLRFSQGIHIWSYDSNNIWYMVWFFLTLLILGLFCFFVLWSLLGVTEINASYLSLIISYKFLGMTRKIFVLASNILYFNHFLNSSSEAESWDLEIVTKERLYEKNISYPRWFPAKFVSADVLIRMNYKTINLYGSGNPHPSQWLGKVLTEFYQVELKSTFDSNSA